MNEFIMIGFSIRKKVISSEFTHKPGTRIVTFDSYISPPHPIFNSKEQWKILGNCLPSTKASLDPRDNRLSVEMSSSLKSILDYYDNLSEADRRIYLVLGFAIDSLDFENRFDAAIQQWSIQFSHEYDISKDLVFLGYDIMNYWLDSSIIVNPELDWKKIESFGPMNEYNLLSDYSSARQIADSGRDIYDEDIPFSVWKIYGIKSLFQN